MVAAVVSELGRLDILVNGAAGNFICLAENLSPNGFGTVVDIDLKGTFNVSRAALPHLKAQGGSVINISATLPYLGTIGQAHASAAKAGVDSLTRTLAVEWGPHGIRVNGIAPGPIEGTEGVRRLTNEKSRESALRALSARPDGDDRRYRERGAVSRVRRRVLRQRRHAGRRRRPVAAVGAHPRRVMTPTPAWAAGVCAGVHAAGSRDVVYVPDNPLSHVLRVFEQRYPRRAADARDARGRSVRHRRRPVPRRPRCRR